MVGDVGCLFAALFDCENNPNEVSIVLLSVAGFERISEPRLRPKIIVQLHTKSAIASPRHKLGAAFVELAACRPLTEQASRPSQTLLQHGDCLQRRLPFALKRRQRGEPISLDLGRALRCLNLSLCPDLDVQDLMPASAMPATTTAPQASRGEPCC